MVAQSAPRGGGIVKKSKKSEGDSIRVGVRLRPIVPQEEGQEPCISIEDNVVTMKAIPSHPSIQREFAFDHAMDSSNRKRPGYVSQQKCYNHMCQWMVEPILEGFHTALFAYGQTGTGKTTTIMGDIQDEHEQGILTRLLSDLFGRIATFQEQGNTIHCSCHMLEVYNEKVKDLLASKINAKDTVEVRMHPAVGVYVKGALQEVVTSFQDCIRLIDYGNNMKTVAQTAMNSKSSRAHTIFQLKLTRTDHEEYKVMSSDTFFVDLAGRENEKTTQCTGQRMVELSFINLSLMHLTHCISRLGKGNANSVGVGKDMSTFRNSKLTLLLANALGGNSKTAMIGTLSPAMVNYEENLSTLKFAEGVKKIKVEAHKAEMVNKAEVLASLKAEVARLKDANYEQKEAVTQQINDTQYLCEEYKKKWEDQVKITVSHNEDRAKLVAKLGAARWQHAVARKKTFNRKDDERLPFLANYSEDALLRGRLILRPAERNREYSMGYQSSCDFVLFPALGVSAITCFLKTEGSEGDSGGDRLFIRANESQSSRSGCTRVEVNGKRIGKDWHELKDRDAVVLGSVPKFYAFIGISSEFAVLQGAFQAMEAADCNQEEESQAKLDIILGPHRTAPCDQQLAQTYVSQLRERNCDASGTRTVDQFLRSAENAQKMVEEANEITSEIMPDENLELELVTFTPILAHGFGEARCPDLAVRLVRKLGQSEKKSRKSAQAPAKRRSRLSTIGCSILSDEIREFEQMLDEDSEILLLWNFTKFEQRFRMMQDAYDNFRLDPSNFTMDPLRNPWAEYGLLEISTIVQAVKGQPQTEDRRTAARESELEEEVASLRMRLFATEQRAKVQSAQQDELRKDNGLPLKQGMRPSLKEPKANDEALWQRCQQLQEDCGNLRSELTSKTESEERLRRWAEDEVRKNKRLEEVIVQLESMLRELQHDPEANPEEIEDSNIYAIAREIFDRSWEVYPDNGINDLLRRVNVGARGEVPRTEVRALFRIVGLPLKDADAFFEELIDQEMQGTIHFNDLKAMFQMVDQHYFESDAGLKGDNPRWPRNPSERTRRNHVPGNHHGASKPKKYSYSADTPRSPSPRARSPSPTSARERVRPFRPTDRPDPTASTGTNGTYKSYTAMRRKLQRQPSR